MQKGHIQQRGRNRYLVRWRQLDSVTGKKQQVGKIVHGDYGRALAFLAEQLSPTRSEKPEPVARTFGSYVANEWKHYTAEHWKEGTHAALGSYSGITSNHSSRE